jgi:hypothetical protein
MVQLETRRVADKKRVVRPLALGPVAFWGSGSSFGHMPLEFGRTDSIGEGGKARHGCRTTPPWAG